MGVIPVAGWFLMWHEKIFEKVLDCRRSPGRSRSESMPYDFSTPAHGDHPGWQVFFDNAYAIAQEALANRACGWRFVSPGDIVDLAGTVATQFMLAVHRGATKDRDRRIYLLTMARNMLLKTVRKATADKRHEQNKVLMSELQAALQDLEGDSWGDEAYLKDLDDTKVNCPDQPDIAADSRTRVSLLYEALGQMPETMRILITSLCLGRMTHAEVGRRLGIEEGTVGSRLRNAVAHLKRQLMEHPLFQEYF